MRKTRRPLATLAAVAVFLASWPRPSLAGQAARAPAPAPPTPAMGLAQAVIGRAESGVGLAKVGAAIQSAEDLPSAFANLRGLGVIEGNEASLAAPGGVAAFRDALEQVWYHAAPKTTPRFQVDPSWSVPAVVARSDGVTYYVHALFPHAPKIVWSPPGLGRVQRLVSALESRGLPLYSERNFPQAYAYVYGRELIDDGARAVSQPSIRPMTGALPVPLKAAWTIFTLGLPLAAVAQAPLSPAAWALLALCAVHNYLLWTGSVPLQRLRLLRLAGQLERKGDLDQALAARRWARHVLTTRPRYEEFRRVKLPLPESSYRATQVSRRAQDIGRAVKAEAQAQGLREVHVLTGANHAEEIAQHLER